MTNVEKAREALLGIGWKGSVAATLDCQIGALLAAGCIAEDGPDVVAAREKVDRTASIVNSLLDRVRDLEAYRVDHAAENVENGRVFSERMHKIEGRLAAIELQSGAVAPIRDEIRDDEFLGPIVGYMRLRLKQDLRDVSNTECEFRALLDQVRPGWRGAKGNR